jgi:hypothetical protein
MVTLLGLADMRNICTYMAHPECMGPVTEGLPFVLWPQHALSPPGADDSTRRAMEQRSLGHAMHTHLVEFLRAFLRTPGLEVGCCDPALLPFLHLLHGYIKPGRLSLCPRASTSACPQNAGLCFQTGWVK